jgi:hypothetical protein
MPPLLKIERRMGAEMTIDGQDRHRGAPPSIRKSMAKAYLGDSVYVDRWHDGFVLTTQNDDGPPSNIIYLEPEVCAALHAYLARLMLLRAPAATVPSTEMD